MENGWNLFSSSGRGQNSNCTNLAWDVWESRYDWSSSSDNHNTHNNPYNHIAAAAPVNTAGVGEAHALMFSRGTHDPHHRACCSSPHPSVYDGSGSGQHYHPDPHLMCLKLGKRHYFEDPSGRPGFSVSKRGKAYYAGGGGGELVGPSTAASVARCQVEGCHVALVNAKEYHRRHKVCEMHSKAPKVVVLGLDQRFCQQCSRFHAVTEFDEAKRSCRRRLAGHNERRRKSSHDHSLPRNPSQENKPVAGKFPYLSSSTGHALSLLSSPKHDPWTPPADLSSRCSAALRELIAENRAATTMARPLMVNRDTHWHHHHAIEEFNRGAHYEPSSYGSHADQIGRAWDRFGEGGANVTLDLMQAPSSAFGLLSMRGKSSEDEECSELWSSLGGTHVV